MYPPLGAFNVSLKGRGSSISCAAQREAPPPPFLFMVATTEGEAVFHDHERGRSSHASSADTTQQRLTNQGQHRLIYCLAVANNGPGPLSASHIYSADREIWQHFQLWVISKLHVNCIFHNTLYIYIYMKYSDISQLIGVDLMFQCSSRLYLTCLSHNICNHV